jgi:competence protein ComEA
LLVHVAGAVARPGLYELRPGARVADALNAAGGARDDADVTRVNLAAPVADGARVYVPAPGEMPPPVVAASTSGADAVTAGGATAPTGGEVDPVDLNNATEQQLEALPGVGPATAQAIIRQREAHPFASVDDLLTVRGIGPAKLETLRPHVRV